MPSVDDKNEDDDDVEEHELRPLRRSLAMEEEERDGLAGPTRHSGRVGLEDDGNGDENNNGDASAEMTVEEQTLDRRTRRKLDCTLLPFLALLFLLNSLDKSNVGNAESAGFTRDAGLSPSDLNLSLAFFFAFFVALQPVGAALGRKFGMRYWVPACMSLWGLCTLGHIWVRRRWQLVVLRIAIASLEAGFYPTTVSYLSLFYTRYEFAVRLGIFYGQTAVAGALGGVLSWAVFSHFEGQPPGTLPQPNAGDRMLGVRVDDSDRGSVEGWRSWEVLFLIEGCTTMVIALIGFFWLPRSADTAWFFSPAEKQWAEERIQRDQNTALDVRARRAYKTVDDRPLAHRNDDEAGDESHHRLLDGPATTPLRHKASTISARSLTADSGLTRRDILSALLSYQIWHLLLCNILSAIPAIAFGVFLPLVIKELSPSLSLSPSASNLLAAPPFAFGAVILFLFTRWSDRSQVRLVPIFWGLGLLLLGLILTLLVPMSSYILRYMSLCILLSGSFIASPLTVAWLTNNTPVAGKRAILLGINGWGNLAGVFSALLYTPEDEKTGYTRPLIITLICVIASFAGFIAFWVLLVRENRWRESITATWSIEEVEREEKSGDMPLPDAVTDGWRGSLKKKFGLDEERQGDEKLTFRYGL